MPDLSIFKNPAPYHIITYGTLLGSEVFQSFIGGVIAYKALPRPMFSQLQEKSFPIYFGMQTFIPPLLALTYPGSLLLGTPSSVKGIFSVTNRWTVLAPLGTIFLSGVVNMLYYGPRTTRVMKLRKHQETRDGKKAYDAGPHSEEMQKLNKSFSTLHGVSTLINLGGIIATITYGFSLASRIV